MGAIVKDEEALIDMSKLRGDEKDVQELIEQGKADRPPPMAPDAFLQLLETGQLWWLLPWLRGHICSCSQV